ncbi:hypothetical protein Glove_166g288 [Diversispora epigaea]|uniref:Ribosomal protein S15 n=1 Tax=Diversispora epigaea TaxID=1348612 RepID=A0A397IZE2_9GLOM|nr:hypothetical protein Glove_166g288 [Diversispora epigaea]
MFARCTKHFSTVKVSFSTSVLERTFHSTFPTLKRIPREIKKKNLAKKLAILEEEKENRPDPIAGVPTEFTRSLLRPSDVYKTATDLTLPQYNNYLIDESDAEIVFKKLPEKMCENSEPNEVKDKQLEYESEKVKILKSMVGLHNANSQSIMKHNIRKAIEEFARFPNDTGSAEVQAAIWTVRILNLHEHLQKNHKDKHNYRNLRTLVHKRQGMLKYLKRESLERYYNCLKKLGLDNKIIEGEIVI